MVVDLGDRVVLRPLPEDAVGDLVGKYRSGVSTDSARERSRGDEAAAADRKRSH